MITNFMKTLRSRLNKQYFEDYYVGSLYHDENTITYFPFTPNDLKAQKLKIAIVYNYQKARFEIWLAGQNKQIQKKYWDIFKNSDWNKYHIPEKVTDGFSIVDDVLMENPTFDNVEIMIEQIKQKALTFIRDISEALK